MFKYGLIIAGGHGNRMRPLSDYIPKPLIKYKNKELITYSLNLFKQYGINNIIVTYNYKSEQLVSFLEKKVNCLINTIEKDNSFFIFHSIVKFIDEPIIVLPCDIIIDVDFKILYDEYNKLNQPACMIVPIIKNSEIQGDTIEIKNNFVTKIGRESKGNFYASGLQIINPKKINMLIDSSDNFYLVWDSLIKKQELIISSNDIKNWEAVDNFNQII